MPNMTLSIPEKLHKEMKKLKYVRWSEVARQSIERKVKEFREIEKIAKKSKLTMKDVLELDKKIKKGLYKRTFR